MDSKPAKAQRAHDLAIAYELYCAICQEDQELISPEGFALNYNKAYEEFMEFLKD